MDRVPENTPESDRDSGISDSNEADEIARVIRPVYEHLSPTAERLEMKCKMEWYDKPSDE